MSDLLRHGAGRVSANGAHAGGERVWQCKDWEDFQLAWKTTEEHPSPHELEVAIGRRFEEMTGKLPFANVRL